MLFDIADIPLYLLNLGVKLVDDTLGLSYELFSADELYLFPLYVLSLQRFQQRKLLWRGVMS
jgi:hypothetical protein